jgi:hypothetical protein
MRMAQPVPVSADRSTGLWGNPANRSEMGL